MKIKLCHMSLFLCLSRISLCLSRISLWQCYQKNVVESGVFAKKDIKRGMAIQRISTEGRFKPSVHCYHMLNYIKVDKL